MRRFHMSRGLWQRLAIVGLAVLLLTVTGPFGTFVDLSVPLRLLYWTAAIGGCSIFMYLAMEAMPLFPDWPAPARMAVGGMIGAVPGAGIVALLELSLRGSEHFLGDYFWFWFCIAGAGFLVTFLRFAVLRQSFMEIAAAAPATDDAFDIRFLGRLPREIGRELISLSMQDHYAEVTTSRGAALILIRFSDALNELAGYPGGQIHRSHWVADGKARRVYRDGNRVFVELVDGRRLPVSRPYLESARSLVGTSKATCADESQRGAMSA